MACGCGAAPGKACAEKLCRQPAPGGRRRGSFFDWEPRLNGVTVGGEVPGSPGALPRSLRDAVENAVPIPGLGLAEESHRWVPRTVVSAEEPAPVGNLAQGH